jgi:hypothetical protein
MPRKWRVHVRGGGALPAGATTAACLALLLAGCGSGKPDYCSNRSDLEASVKGLTDVQALKSGGVDELKSRLSTVQSDATKVVDSAKSDFPSQTSAISSSLANLKSALQALPSNPTPAQLAAVATSGKALVTSVNDFMQASGSKC